MLEMAAIYETQLKRLFAGIVFNDKYKFYNFGSWFDEYKSSQNTWNSHEFVSTSVKCVSETPFERNINGYIKYGIERDSLNVSGLAIASFGRPSMEFVKDLKQAINDIFLRYHLNKLNFSVVCGSKMERSYDKAIQLMNGRIVGIKERQVKLFDGYYYDEKLYEVIAEKFKKL